MLPTMLFILVLLIIIAVVASFIGGKVEVQPKTALVYKNTITGDVGAKMPGVDTIYPWQKEQGIVSLRDEPQTPEPTSVNTADPVPLGIEYEITTFKVAEDEECICLAFTKIDYDKRLENTIVKIKVAFQDVIGRLFFNDIYVEKDKTQNGGKEEESKEKKGVDREKITTIETDVNKKLKVLKSEWGLEVEIQINNIKIPDIITDAMEDEMRAKYDGQAIAEKAKAIGDSPHADKLIFVSGLVDALRAWKGKP